MGVVGHADDQENHTLFPFAHGGSGFYMVENGRKENELTFTCWAVDRNSRDVHDPSIIASGRLRAENVKLCAVRVTHRELRPKGTGISIVVDCEYGHRFSARWPNPNRRTGSDEPTTLFFVKESTLQPKMISASPLVGEEVPAHLSEDHKWVLDEHRWRILWLPPIRRAEISTEDLRVRVVSCWRGRQLAIPAADGLLTLVDFSNVKFEAGDSTPSLF